jgi:hypothetical protein
MPDHLVKTLKARMQYERMMLALPPMDSDPFRHLRRSSKLSFEKPPKKGGLSGSIFHHRNV